MKRLWAVAALLAIAAIPIILANNSPAKRRMPVPVAGDSNDIFEWELRTE